MIPVHVQTPWKLSTSHPPSRFNRRDLAGNRDSFVGLDVNVGSPFEINSPFEIGMGLELRIVNLEEI
jgi:hypothetical protein